MNRNQVIVSQESNNRADNQVSTDHNRKTMCHQGSMTNLQYRSLLPMASIGRAFLKPKKARLLSTPSIWVQGVILGGQN